MQCGRHLSASHSPFTVLLKKRDEIVSIDEETGKVSVMYCEQCERYDGPMGEAQMFEKMNLKEQAAAARAEKVQLKKRKREAEETHKKEIQVKGFPNHSFRFSLRL